MEVVLGIDVGQKIDPTAICVAQVRHLPGPHGRDEEHYRVRFLQRLPLGTSYPDVADRVHQIVAGVREKAQLVNLTTYVDATGVGQPVVDIMSREGLDCTPVYFTHGDRRVVQQDKSVSLGKAFLVSRLQALLQTGRILLPKTSEAHALAQELQDYEIRIEENANEKYGAFRVGSHDDLVTALGLATQPDRPGMPFGWYLNDEEFLAGLGMTRRDIEGDDDDG